MKKVLIVGFLWPYCRYEGGCSRFEGVAKYLSNFGWKPIVLTPFLSKKPDFNVKIIETPYREIFYSRIIALLKEILNSQETFTNEKLRTVFAIGNRRSTARRIAMLIKGIIAYPDGTRGWIPFAIRAGERVIEKENIDAMISFWPITAHLVAKELKRKYDIPWIADYSHLWSQWSFYQYGPIRRIFDKRLEVRTIRSADALTTVCQPLAQDLKALHKQKHITPIIHGFDPSWIKSGSAPLTSKFTITYTGNVLEKPSNFFVALKKLLDVGTIKREDIEVLFYGGIQEWLKEEIARYNLSDIVNQCGVVSHSAALRNQRKSQILLDLELNDIKLKGYYNVKLFEYLAAQRPVLAVGMASDEGVKNILFETKAGVYCSNHGEIGDALYRFYEEYRQKGKVCYNGDLEQINKYSYREMARKYSEILEIVMKNACQEKGLSSTFKH